MYLFIEKGLIGEISYIAKRYSEVNNKYDPKKNYDPKKPSKTVKLPLIWVICMAEQWMVIFLMVDLNLNSQR